MKRIPLFCLKLSAALLMQAAAGDLLAQQRQLPVVPLNIGIHVVHAEVAATPEEREQGLMFRKNMGPNNGMLFLFGTPSGVCMWMKNTLIPLSVAFIDSAGKIINIEDMQPQTTTSHCAKKPIFYALEMNRGWFRQKHIGPGAVIDGLPR